MSDPNVTIRFSGQGDGALRVADSVGKALDTLAVKSQGARIGLFRVSQVMDTVSARSANVRKMGAAYQEAVGGIQSAINASTRSAAAFTQMADSAARAQLAAKQLNAATRTQPVITPGTVRTPNNAAAGIPSFAALGLGGASGMAGMARMAVQMAGITFGAAAAGNEIRKLVTANMDLDAAMSRVAAVGALDKTSAQFRELTTLVMDLGGKTRYSAVEAADGLKELIAAGYKATDAAKILSDTLDLAATENMGMGRASEIVVASLQSFGLGVDQSTRVTNVLARAANASTASIDGMGEAFKFIAPVSSALKVSMEETAAAVAILSNNGVQAGMAGRGLGAMMARMVAPSKDAQEAIEAAGLSVAALNPAVVGLGGSFKALQSIDTAGLVKLFGAENLDVANIVKSNADAFGTMVEAMKDTSITAQSMAAKSMDNLGGDFKKLSASMQKIRTELGADLYASIRGYAQSFTTTLNENKDAIISSIQAFGRLMVTAGEVALLYVKLRIAAAAFKAVSMSGTLIADVANFARSTKAVIANTIAMIANARARKGVSSPVMGPQTSGMAVMMTQSVAEAFGKGAPTVGAAAGRLMGTVGAIATAAIAGWEIGSAIEKHFQVSEKYVAWLYKGRDAATAMTNDMLESSGKLLAEAKTEKDAERAKASIKADMVRLEEAIATARKEGNTNEVGIYQQTLDILAAKLRLTDRTVERNVENARLADAEARANWEAAQAAKDKAAADQRAALAMARMEESAAKLKGELPELAKAILNSLPKEQQINILKGSSEATIREAESLRVKINDAIRKGGGGSDVKLLDKVAEIKTVDDLVLYYRTVIATIRKTGNENLLGLPDMEALTAALKNVMDAKADLTTAEQAVKRAEEEKVKKAQTVADITAEIAINEAKAAGDTKRAEKLEREQKILEEQRRIQEALGKDDPASEKRAKDLATRKVDAEIAANKKPQKPSEVVADSLQAVGGGGRYYGAGNTEAAAQLRAAQDTAANTKIIADRIINLTGGGTTSANGTTGPAQGAGRQIDLLSEMSGYLKTLANKATGGGILEVGIS